MVIDIFAHHISKRVGNIISREKYYGPGRQFDFPIQNASAEIRLELMDKYGITMQVLTQTSPVLLGFNANEAAEICRISNDDNNIFCQAYPDRFVNVCIISLLDVKSALAELDRCVVELDCRGVTLSTNYNGRGLDSPEYFPLYDKIAKYDLPILLQPTHWESYPCMDMTMMAAFGWPFDTTQAIWRLIFGEVFDKYPSLKIITHHCGGMLPFFVRRLEGMGHSQAHKFNRQLSEYWNNIYGDCIVYSPSAISCGLDFFSTDRLIYGSDYPFGPEAGEFGIRQSLNTVKTLNIPENDKLKILGNNVRKLLKIK